MAVLVVVGWIAVHGLWYRVGWTDAAWPTTAAVAIGALCTGGFVFGGLMLLNAVMNRVADVQDWMRINADLDAAIADGQALKAQLHAERQARQRAETERDIAMLKATRPAPVMVTPVAEDDTVYVDAQALIKRRWNGLKWGRDAMVDAGWTPARWTEAMELVKLAGIAVSSGKANVPFDNAVDVSVPLAMLATWQERSEQVSERRMIAANG